VEVVGAFEVDEVVEDVVVVDDDVDELELELDDEDVVVVVVLLEELDDELDDEELELDDIDVEDVLEDAEVVALVESGTPPGPAMICNIFVVIELKTVGAREIWLLSRSYTTYIAVSTVSPTIYPPELPCIPKVQNWLLESGKTTSWLKGTAIVIPLNWKFISFVLEPAEQRMYAKVGSFE
jgi:hypothetical protein